MNDTNMKARKILFHCPDCGKPRARREGFICHYCEAVRKRHAWRWATKDGVVK
jgi:ribosomal protein L37AE/L43A